METTVLDTGTVNSRHILLITANGGAPNEFWSQTLAELGFHYTCVDFAEWRDEFDAETPLFVLLDASKWMDEALQACREFCKAHPAVPLIAILSRNELVKHGSIWYSTGAESFLRQDATRAEVETVLKNELKAARLEKDLAEHKQKIINSNHYDTATHFLTRRHFFYDAHRECGRARRYGRELSCLMINIDYLEEYSRFFGQPCSNYLLRSLSTLVRRWTRESDIVARFASDKIVALLPETNVYGAVIARERILDAIAHHQFEWKGEPLPVSLSIGEASRVQTGEVSKSDADKTPLVSVREEMAQILEDADMAVEVAQRSSPRPDIFIEYSRAEMPAG